MINLRNIQTKLVVPKKHYSEYGNYYFRNAEDILEAVNKLLKPNEFITLNDEIIQIGDRYYLKATVVLSNGVDSISVSAYAREALEKTKMDVAQVTGSASSYARKYALTGLFAIDDGIDPDVLKDSSRPASKPATPAPMRSTVCNCNTTSAYHAKWCNAQKGATL